jgi:hypothetical protein
VLVLLLFVYVFAVSVVIVVAVVVVVVARHLRLSCVECVVDAISDIVGDSVVACVGN